VKTKLFTLLGAMIALATPMFAQGGSAAPAADSHFWIWIASGFSMAIASGLCGLAQAKAVAAACEGMGRNPGASAAIRFALIFGLVMIESLALYTLVVIFVQIRP
jgi:F-type H+-transporting ATPase subunit c